MRTIKLGNSNLEVSVFALGIMRMSALSTDQAGKVLRTAIDHGINFIDSADIYGKGKSEEVFAAAMKKEGLKRDQFYIQSKAGIVPGLRYDFSKKYLIKAVDGILQRMNIDYLDSFLLHRPDPLMDSKEVSETFNQLYQSGKVRHFGVSNFDIGQFLLLQEDLDKRLLVNQLQFSLTHSEMIDSVINFGHGENFLAFAKRDNVTVQAWSPFQAKSGKGSFIDSPEYPKLNEKLRELSIKYQVSKNAIAAAWILRHPAQIQVMLGTMNLKHLKDSIDGVEVELSRQEWYDLYLAAGNYLP
ncbi:aldo/keto reductase [Xylocopilactobacillus apis]|uniref:Aldo/keto reductase n=1 Tax=Xylocopilactobacillus apis TaxID=2932183 RepID=A0AAU9D0D5_9LACO|nr:aldo/keto reductase [Xylocopilactobacillus apis]BDR55976.1 aldo/keto reductase [Xylocopilactobacillus apis]